MTAPKLKVAVLFMTAAHIFVFAAVDVCTGITFITRQYVTTVTISCHYLLLMFYDTYWIHTSLCYWADECLGDVNSLYSILKPNLLFIISLDRQNKTQSFTLKLSCIISTVANI